MPAGYLFQSAAKGMGIQAGKWRSQKNSIVGADILMGSFGYVLDRLKKSFDSIELKREFEMVADKGSFNPGATIKKSRKTAI